MNTPKASRAFFLLLAIALASVAKSQDIPCVRRPTGSNGPSFAAESLAFYATYLLAAGSDAAAGDNGWRVEKRLLPSGALDKSFGRAGVMTTNPSPGNDFARAIVVDGSDFYLGGLDGGGPPPSVHQWRIEKRSASTGVLVTRFGNHGVVTSNPSTQPVRITALVIDDDFLYAAGTDDHDRWRIEKRDLNTGALVSDFGDAGAVASREGEPLGIGSDGKLLLVVGLAPQSGKLLVERRDASDGALEGEWSPDFALDPDRNASTASAAGNFLYRQGHGVIRGNTWRVQIESSKGGFALGFASTIPAAGPDIKLSLRARRDVSHSALNVYPLPRCGATAIDLEEHFADGP